VRPGAWKAARVWVGPLAAVVLLGGLAAVWRHLQGQPAAQSVQPAPSVLDVDGAQVRQVTITAGGRTLSLYRGQDAKGQTVWHVGAADGPTARPFAVDDLLGDLHPLSADRLVTRTPSADDLKAFGLEPPGRQLAVSLQDGRTVTVQVGSESPVGGYYARRTGDAAVYLIPSTLPDLLKATPQDWLPQPAAGR
jgi:hypothetical protein